MDKKDKGRIVVGAGILTAVGIYALTRGKKPPEIYTCPYCGAEFATLEELQAHILAEHPGEEEVGIIQGYVVNAETDDHIPNAAIYLDGEFALYSWTWDVGGYRIAAIPYGTHTITVEANDYETTDFQIVIDQPIQSINLEMPPLPPAPPGEWSEGVEVQSVFPEPSAAYLGETVNIDVYIQYGIHDPGAYPVPTTIFGTIKVNGQELKKEFNIDYRNPTLRFPYIASQVGEFTAIAQDKSAKFTVAESPVGTYYSPFGGTRIPVCTQFVVPNVGPIPLVIDKEDFVYPDDFVFSPLYTEMIEKGLMTGFFPKFLFTKEQMEAGYPTNWSAEVYTYDAYIRWKGTKYVHNRNDGVVLVPTDYHTPSPYWESKEKLAQMIAQPRYTSLQLGIGRFLISAEIGGFYNFPEVAGFPPNIDPIRGITNWAKPIIWGKSGNTDWIVCPYCGEAAGHTTREYPYSGPQREEVARKLLEHIEQVHPDHPLTESAWF